MVVAYNQKTSRTQTLDANGLRQNTSLQCFIKIFASREQTKANNKIYERKSQL
ncbi:hypothetical protein C3B55_00626 [Candidatus Pseudomonas adelgestsugas]|uniref:Uncharacterized protein n=1 Tax=Candidatus Pseudomonas adelgestsugas TaxID=1302376 RepID=A0ABX5R8H8_9PSED|nr:hypothetical protein C3B55_00626 [Candidatus Pseudomonas adelgestsugas]